ncbi:hypothetical protein N7516_010640 [Penicillium verrucosum]|uniref:uncharacterized protein n=1 Tax=Penicillium verrucosum TaxID=60171 RepID=UPI002544DFDD|nr:uncharacterized protein N7516_010640 [Penicillium verrucosum]KAJ5922937.1 hypothetical protein N7516_010640 [Penicillium verrucosum]
MTTKENTSQFPPSTADTYKQFTAARATPTERENGDCTLQVDDLNKEFVNHDQAEADESGNDDPKLSTPVQRKRRSYRKWYICGGVSIVVLLIVIIVPLTVVTKR